jgi:hypothetical protein
MVGRCQKLCLKCLWNVLYLFFKHGVTWMPKGNTDPSVPEQSMPEREMDAYSLPLLYPLNRCHVLSGETKWCVVIHESRNFSSFPSRSYKLFYSTCIFPHTFPHHPSMKKFCFDFCLNTIFQQSRMITYSNCLFL